MLPALSPDGHWLMYASDESGRNEIYVQSFPKPSGNGRFQPKEAFIRAGRATGANSFSCLDQLGQPRSK